MTGFGEQLRVEQVKIAIYANIYACIIILGWLWDLRLFNRYYLLRHLLKNHPILIADSLLKDVAHPQINCVNDLSFIIRVSHITVYDNLRNEKKHYGYSNWLRVGTWSMIPARSQEAKWGIKRAVNAECVYLMQPCEWLWQTHQILLNREYADVTLIIQATRIQYHIAWKCFVGEELNRTCRDHLRT
jgi:hypothetical protein